MQSNSLKYLKRVMAAIAATVGLIATLTGCAPESPKTVTIATHDSFVISDELIQKFETESGYQLEVVKLGDAGELTNKLVLTKDQPVADAFFGIDNTFRGVAESNGIVDGDFTQIDFADVCFNYDKQWFATKGIEAPKTWRELTSPRFRGLTVVENPATSSTGLSFLFATVAALGEPSWKTWWAAMRQNDLKVVAGWEQAYYTEFSGSAGKGPYPIVLSYSSSPADEVDDAGQSRTASISSECFRQIEYAGVLANAANPEGAKALVKFMLSEAFQSALPSAMYVYPVDQTVALPQQWSRLAPASSSFVDTTGLDFDANRSRWIDEWAETQKSKD